ncbi:CocE/NonD family hydrolase [Streptomyces sp. NPDC050287]|uniref:CocE/NonD family hydrolase n=1 Tax=Streptomyces sp. NPDC050287 TaxID=3365608 RepID=UPI0037AE9CB5
MLQTSAGRVARAVMVLVATASLLVGASAAAQASPWAKRTWGYLTTPDGVQLRYSVLLPQATGRFPVALKYDGYDAGTIGGAAYQAGDSWESSALDSRLLAAGYAVVGVSMRGTGCSSGTFGVFSPSWGSDGALAVQWAAAQPWSTGRVGMYGWSWTGISQLFTASQRPPALAALAPGMVVTDPLRDVGAPGGVINGEFPTLWWGTIMDTWTLDSRNAAGDGDPTCAANVASNLATGQASSPTTAYGHPFYDSYWAERDLRSQTAKITAPVLSVEDWQDEEVGPRGGYYQDLLNPDTTWYIGSNGQHDLYASTSVQNQLVPFLDHFVKGVNNGFEQTPHVRLWMETTAPGAPLPSEDELAQATPSWTLTAPKLPVPVRPTTLYLNADRTLTGARGADGTLTYPPAPGPSVNNGALGSAVTGGNAGPAGEETWSSAPPTGVSFTTAALNKTVTLAGSASLDVWLSSTTPDTALQATVTEVRPDGEEAYVQRGWLQVSDRAIDPSLSTPLRPVHPQTLAAVQPLQPGVPVQARLEIEKFTHTFRRGSALRIWIDAPSGTGIWNFPATNAGLNTIYSDAGHPSSLTVGLLSTRPAPVGLPACGTVIAEPCRATTVTIPDTPPVDWPDLG